MGIDSCAGRLAGAPQPQNNTGVWDGHQLPRVRPFHDGSFNPPAAVSIDNPRAGRSCQRRPGNGGCAAVFLWLNASVATDVGPNESLRARVDRSLSANGLPCSGAWSTLDVDTLLRASQAEDRVQTRPPPV